MITKAEKEHFLEDGFLVLPQIIDKETLEQLRTAYDDVLQSEQDTDASDRYLGGKTRQIVFAEKAHPTFAANKALEVGREIAAALRGWQDPAFFYSQLLYKPPGHPHVTPWHQDDAYGAMPFTAAGTPLGHSSLQFWLAIDDADENNGCMHFHPNPDHDTLLPHCVTDGNPQDEGRLLGLIDPDSHIEPDRVVPCPIRAGGVTIHDSGTLHFTPANRSDRPRRAYIFNFADPEMVKAYHSATQAV